MLRILPHLTVSPAHLLAATILLASTACSEDPPTGAAPGGAAGSSGSSAGGGGSGGSGGSGASAGTGAGGSGASSGSGGAGGSGASAGSGGAGGSGASAGTGATSSGGSAGAAGTGAASSGGSAGTGGGGSGGAGSGGTAGSGVVSEDCPGRPCAPETLEAGVFGDWILPGCCADQMSDICGLDVAGVENLIGATGCYQLAKPGAPSASCLAHGVGTLGLTAEGCCQENGMCGIVLDTTAMGSSVGAMGPDFGCHDPTDFVIDYMPVSCTPD